MNRFFTRTATRTATRIATRVASRLSVGAVAAVGLLGTLSACSPESLVDADPPSTVATPSTLKTAAGALALYNGATNLFAAAFGGGTSSGSDGFVYATGLETDEFQVGPLYSEWIDARDNSANFDLGAESAQSVVYERMQGARTAAYQARQALQQYGAPGSNALIGRMYAYEAYTIVLLAEYFCNGIPLTTVNFQSDPIYSPGLTTTELFTRADALFDTAITLSGDSSKYINLARVGKGRALLGLGKLPEAAAAVAAVPQNFAFNVDFSATVQVTINGVGFYMQNMLGPPPLGLGTVMVVDNEGGRGLPWSTDPRIPIDPTGAYNFGLGPFPTKYPQNNSPIRLADWNEAQLITAEASLKAGTSNWLTILNGLRANCTTASGCTMVPGITGGTTQLPPLVDSLTPVKRLTQLMSERAYWMYATGHRQGDLRRMMHLYDVDDVYPTGTYASAAYGGKSTIYGSDVVALPGRSEQQFNPKYKGCFDRNP